MSFNQYEAAHYLEDGTGCRLGSNCPLSSAHGRLDEAHRHFHSAEAHYSDPRGFVTSLNACIQSLRNVTFAVQKQKATIIGFAQWYEPWQRAMKKDLVLSWLADARNTVVKENDLETSSVASVSVVEAYEQPGTVQFHFPPLETEESLARRLAAELQLAASERADRILRVERRWVAATLPEMELLAALSHAYAVLARLVADVHLAPKGRVNVAAAVPEELPGQKLRCMEEAGQLRVHQVRLDSGDGLEVRRTEVGKRDPESVMQAVEHYGGERALEPFRLTKSQSLRERCEALFSGARRIIETDGYHDQIVMLVTGSRVVLVRLDATDKIDKLLLWRAVADEVRRVRAEAAIAIGEVWISKAEAGQQLISPSRNPNRGEALQLTAISASGERVGLSTTIYREGGQVILGQTTDDSHAAAAFFQPVLDVWVEMQLRASIGPKDPS